MDILSELTELKEAHSKLEADYKAASELLEVGATELQGLKAQLSAKDAEIEEQAKQVRGYKASHLAADAELSKVRAELETLTANQKTAEQKAVEIVAKQGVAPISISATGSEVLTQAEALKAYQGLLAVNPQQAGEYYAKHRDVLIK